MRRKTIQKLTRKKTNKITIEATGSNNNEENQKTIDNSKEKHADIVDLRNSLDPNTIKREKYNRKKSFQNSKQKSTITLSSYAMLLGSLGKGSFSEVFKGKLVGTGKMVAIK